MKLPILFNEEIIQLDTMPHNPLIDLHINCGSPIDNFQTKIPWYSAEIGQTLHPASLIVRSNLGVNYRPFFDDLKTHGTVRLEKENYGLTATNYQELTLKNDVIEKLDRLYNETKREEFNWIQNSIYAQYFEVTLSQNELNYNQKYIYIPMKHFRFFEKVILPHFFKNEEVLFIRNSVIEYIYYISIPPSRSPLGFKPNYRLTNADRCCFDFHSEDEVSTILARDIASEYFLEQWQRSRINN